MEKQMSDQEFQTLQNKILVAESYVRDLQTVYMGQTGRRLHVFGLPSQESRIEATTAIMSDLEEMT